MQPSEVGVLIDDSFDQRDLTAAIIHLAVQGVITIHEEDDGDDFRLELHPEVRQKTSLRKLREAAGRQHVRRRRDERDALRAQARVRRPA